MKGIIRNVVTTWSRLSSNITNEKKNSHVKDDNNVNNPIIMCISSTY